MPLETMSSIIAIGLLGKLFQILFLQHFHEIYIMTLQCGLKKRVTLLQYLKLPLGLKTVSVRGSSFSFIVLSLH